MRRLLIVCAALLAASFAQAAETKKTLSLELNDLQAAEGGGCRAVFVLHNGLGSALKKLAFRVVAFDTQQHARLFLSLDVGELAVDKTRVFRFDLGSDVKCDSLGRMVLDDVTACEGGGLAPADCLAAVALSSRAAVQFDF